MSADIVVNESSSKVWHGDPSRKQLTMQRSFSLVNVVLYVLLLLLLAISSHLVTSKTDVISFEHIEKCLEEPLRYLDNLQLKIRHSQFSEDIENPYIQWLLHYAEVSKTLTTYQLAENGLEELGKRDNYVVITDMLNFGSSARQFATAVGAFFFIIEGELQMTGLLEHFRVMFYDYFIFPNYLLTEKGVLIYDPFAVNANGEYGQLVEYNGHGDPQHYLFSNMRGFPLKILIFTSVYSRPIYDKVKRKISNYTGVDVRVAYLLQEQLNFTMELQEPDNDSYGGRLPDGSFNGALGAILNKKVDICFTGFFVKDYGTWDIEFSVAMYDDQLCIYTRKAERVPSYILPILAIHYNVWIGFIGIAFLSAFVWASLRTLALSLDIYNMELPRILRKPFRYQYLTILTDTWVVWVRVCLNRHPVFHSEKVFVASLCLVSVIFGAIFECSLASVHIKPLFFNDINTLQELDDSGLPIYYRHISMGDDLFPADTSPLFARLDNKTSYLSDSKYNLMKHIVNDGREAGVNRYKTMMLQTLEVVATKKIWIIPECPKTYRISYVWLRDAPWEESINYLLLKYIQYGIVQKFGQDMKIETHKEIIRRRLYETTESFKILEVEELQLAFYVVIVGNLMAALVWLIEIFVPPKKMRPQVSTNSNLMKV